MCGQIPGQPGRLSRREFLKLLANTMGAAAALVTRRHSPETPPSEQVDYGSGKYGAGRYGKNTGKYPNFLPVIRK